MKKVVVLEAFSFVGFHVINKFLEEGIEVVGVDRIDTDVKEEMGLFVGRNSLFHLQNEENDLGEADVVVACFYEEKDYSLYKKFIHPSQGLIELYSADEPIFHSSNRIKLPSLYGPWQEVGKDELEEKNVIYIEDAVAYIYEKVQQFFEEQRIEEGTIPINTSFEIGKKQVEEHERQFKHLYKSR